MNSFPAAFGRLCVETVHTFLTSTAYQGQPPSGGCVLKLKGVSNAEYIDFPAAFGRLCVETLNN